MVKKKRTKYNAGKVAPKAKYKLTAKPRSTPATNHFKTGNEPNETGVMDDNVDYRVLTKRSYADVKNGTNSLKGGKPKEIKVINAQRFVMLHLPEAKLGKLVDVLYQIAMGEQYSEAARIKSSEILLSYGIGTPTTKIQLEPRTEKFTVTHNVIHLDDRSQLDESSNSVRNQSNVTTDDAG